MIGFIKEISTESLVDRRQIGWIGYIEGDALIRVKVVRSPWGGLFLSHVSGFNHGVTVRTVVYQDKEMWKRKQEYLLEEFRKSVGDDYYFNFRKEIIEKGGSYENEPIS